MNCWSNAGLVGAAVWKMGSCKYFIPKRSRIAFGRLGRLAYFNIISSYFHSTAMGLFSWLQLRTVRRARVPPHECPSTNPGTVGAHTLLFQQVRQREAGPFIRIKGVFDRPFVQCDGGTQSIICRNNDEAEVKKSISMVWREHRLGADSEVPTMEMQGYSSNQDWSGTIGKGSPLTTDQLGSWCFGPCGSRRQHQWTRRPLL